MDMGTCDHCEKPAILMVNGGRGCADHIDAVMSGAFQHIQNVRKSLEES